MKELATTNFRLPRALLKALKRRAVEEERSVSAILRDLIASYLGLSPERRSEAEVVAAQKRAMRPWIGTSLGPGFSGRDHDEVLYGKKR